MRPTERETKTKTRKITTQPVKRLNPGKVPSKQRSKNCDKRKCL